ncbi:molybdopterin dinucleotide binding domain-containing protein, partial [Paracoccus sp. (in: a-proteobacteria)]|uniref:molybdopterin dinucleotide binding domain-containing protein n=1 Tax=Paracoccus sp. TaxID=267 RepID=UPI0035B07A4F
LTWDYADPNEPMPDELAREMNGRALRTVYDLKDTTKVVAEAGQQLANFGQYRDDGSTMGGCWIYAGSWTEDGNMMARRDNTDPDDTGAFLNWSFAWPANRRILYNRASCDLQGKPWDPSRKIIEWTGEKWEGYDVPDIAVTAKPEEVGPFIMNPEGSSRLFSRGMMRDGPFPTHMEPFESPIANPFNARMRGNPVARVFESDAEKFAAIGDPEFPFVATSYRLTEHFHYWTKHNPVNAVLQPEFFVEISEELAAERGIERGGRVRVWSKRGEVWAKALVTKRIRPMQVDGKTVHVIGIPLHWGFMGAARKGFGPNSLSSQVGDANVETPEFKAFMVNIEPSAEEPVA